MDKTDDTLLSCYMDGELPADELGRLEGRLSSEPALRARLDAMRDADAAARKLMTAVDAAPMPETVLQMLQADSKPRDNVVAFPKRGMDRFLQMPVAIAASIALAVGFIVSELSEQAPGIDNAGSALSARSIDQNSALHRLLESSVSGQVEMLDGDVRGQALLTFTDKNDRYCRQLRVDFADNSAHGVACRQDNAWQLEALAYTDAVTEGQYQTAAGSTPFTISAAVDGLIGSDDPLDPEQENQVISKSWKKTE